MFGLYDSALGELTIGHLAMFVVAGVIIYLGIGRKMEPVLLVPIGFGILLVNLPLGGVMTYDENISSSVSAVWGSSSANVYAVAEDGTIVRYDGSTWSSLKSETIEDLPEDLNDIHGWSSDIFVVGEQGTILHYDSIDWTLMESTTSKHLYGVWGNSPSNIFAVGEEGTLLHYEGNTWNIVDSGTTNTLFSVWGNSASNIFAVGENGFILHYDGTTWNAIDSGNTSTLYSIWGNSASNVFAVGENGSILHYDGSIWKQMPSSSDSLFDVWGYSSSNIFAVGEKGSILHYDGAHWNSMDSDTSHSIFSVWGCSSSEAFAVGEDGTVLHYEEDKWKSTSAGGLPSKGGLKDIEEGNIGVLNLLFHWGIASELIPLLIFLGVGAMTDFRTAIARPLSFVFGAAAQLGVFVVFIIAYLTGWFDAAEAACVAIIGGSDGPPTVILTIEKAAHLLGPITLVAYSYMALVPTLQPPIIRLLTSKEERAIYMKPQVREVSKLETIIFPIMVFVVAGLLVPRSIPLIGMFMFGNLLRSSGVTDRLANSAGGVFVDVLTFLLGLTVGVLMPAEVFFQTQTLMVIGLAIVAFSVSTAGGIWAAKIANLFLKEKINPLIGAAGVSAVPMAARVAQKMGQEANPRNFLLMHAMGPNVAGCVATSVVAGIFLSLV